MFDTSRRFDCEMKDKKETLALLGRTELFSGVRASDLETLLAETRTRRFPAGSYILREGDPGDYLHVVAGGEVQIARTTAAGEEVVFGILGTGDVFGELALLEDHGVRGADAQALTATECLLLHRRAFVAFLQAHPEIMWRVVTQLIGRIRRKDEEFASLAFHDIPGRVARKLLELAAARGEPSGSGTLIALPLSQRTLAGLVGASRENVNRALSRFGSLGLLKLERGRITLLRPEELRRRAD
jgi:CRP/FNR family transcriptional regulator/CRP/FNR family cyclic AMP-dependent transcriptional regulator